MGGLRSALLVLQFTMTVLESRHSVLEYLGVNKPFFSPAGEEEVRVQEGATAFLPCQVYNRHNLSVSWVRVRDSHILTVDRETFISDPRFSSANRKEKMCSVVTLAISETRARDAGRYECQVSFQPKISRSVKLVVVTPRVRLLAEPDIHVKEGSEVSMNCVVSNTVAPLPFITWLHDTQVVESRAGVRLELVQNSSLTVSTLQLAGATLAQAGQYRCQPPGLSPVSTVLHVIRAEQEQKLPMMETVGSSSAPPSCLTLTTATALMGPFKLLFFYVAIRPKTN